LTVTLATDKVEFSLLRRTAFTQCICHVNLCTTAITILLQPDLQLKYKCKEINRSLDISGRP